MLLIKSKNYKERIFVPEICDKDFRKIHIQKITSTERVGLAAQEGYEKHMYYFITQGSTYWHWIMSYTARGGREKLIDFVFSKSRYEWDYDRGLACAALGGHEKIINFFISKGAVSWNWGMSCAALGGHEMLVKFFISKGANDWDRGMVCAAQGNHKRLTEFFEKKMIK